MVTHSKGGKLDGIYTNGIVIGRRIDPCKENALKFGS